MDTSLDSVIKRLQEIREEVGGEAHVRVCKGYTLTQHDWEPYVPIDLIGYHKKVIYSEKDDRAVAEVVIFPVFRNLCYV
jgi:hypothetical protein